MNNNPNPYIEPHDVAENVVLCSNCKFAISGKEGPLQWWAETSSGNLCSQCFIKIWETQGGSKDFEVGFIHNVDPIDPMPIMNMWNLLAQIVALWHGNPISQSTMEELIVEAEKLLDETMVGQVPTQNILTNDSTETQ